MVTGSSNTDTTSSISRHFSFTHHVLQAVIQHHYLEQEILEESWMTSTLTEIIRHILWAKEFLDSTELVSSLASKGMLLFLNIQ